MIKAIDEPPVSMDLWRLKEKDKEDKRINGNIIFFKKKKNTNMK